MKKAILLTVLVTVLALGCGGETGKNTNKGKDRPTPPAGAADAKEATPK